MLLKGKRALITGSTSGIGLAIARAYAAEGAAVMINGFGDPGEIEAIRAELEAASGAKALHDGADLGDAGAIAAMIARCTSELGGLDILINNAGITRDNLLMRMKDEEFEEVIRVNLEAAFRLMRAGARPMMKARFGRIISVTSVVGVTGNPGQANYVASKAGLIGMTKTVATEVARRGVTVNAVAPGFIDTDMTTELPESVLDAVPAKRVGRPEEVAAAVRFLASDAASYVTATTLFVDGGMSA